MRLNMSSFPIISWIGASHRLLIKVHIIIGIDKNNCVCSENYKKKNRISFGMQNVKIRINHRGNYLVP